MGHVVFVIRMFRICTQQHGILVYMAVCGHFINLFDWAWGRCQGALRSQIVPGVQCFHKQLLLDVAVQFCHHTLNRTKYNLWPKMLIHFRLAWYYDATKMLF